MNIDWHPFEQGTVLTQGPAMNNNSLRGGTCLRPYAAGIGPSSPAVILTGIQWPRNKRNKELKCQNIICWSSYLHKQSYTHARAHTYCCLCWVQKGSYCGSSSLHRLGGISCQWDHEPLPPVKDQLIISIHTRTHLNTHTNQWMYRLHMKRTLLKKLSMKPSGQSSGTESSSSTCVLVCAGRK